MKADTAIRPKAVSLAEVISGIKQAHKEGRNLDGHIRVFWRRIYETAPALDYSTEEQTRYARRIMGNPDFCNALAEVLISNGLPKCIETHCLSRPIFWLMRKHNALVAAQRDEGEGKGSIHLWYPRRQKFRRMKGAYAKAFDEYLPYMRANLRIALDRRQNL